VVRPVAQLSSTALGGQWRDVIDAKQDFGMEVGAYMASLFFDCNHIDISSIFLFAPCGTSKTHCEA